ncbi:MAG: hypothetical protein IPK26_13600 [Planctomycetes bacterium]|nr:hypothetical protein [Planctomycetota bacterium]
MLAACSGGGNPGDPPPENRGDAELVELRWGRLADVYGLRRAGEQLQPELFASDQLLGSDIADDVDAAALAGNAGGGRYDFLGADADSLQPRLLIPFEIGSPDFERAFAALDDRTTEVTPLQVGMRDAIFSVVPRNAALRLRFSRDLGIDQDFFTARGSRGEDLGVRNPEAVQLVEITGQDRGDADDAHHCRSALRCAGPN